MKKIKFLKIKLIIFFSLIFLGYLFVFVQSRPDLENENKDKSEQENNANQLTRIDHISSASEDVNLPSIAPDIEFNLTASLDDWQRVYGNKIKSLIISADPENLPPYLYHPGFEKLYPSIFPEDAWIIGFEAGVTGAPSENLHHLSLYDTGTPSKFCDLLSKYENLLFASGKELTSIIFPLGFAYPVIGDSLMSTYVMYHNPNSSAQDNVVVSLTIWYISKQDADLKATFPLFLDILGNCSPGEYYVPPNSRMISQSGEKQRIGQPGELIIIGGHLHDFSEYLTVSLNGKPIHTFIPELNDKSELVLFEPVWPKNLILNSNDYLELEASYNNTSDVRLEVMSQSLLFIYLPNEN